LTFWLISPALRSKKLIAPCWPSNSQPNIFEVTTVGIAHGISMAARTTARPANCSASSSAMPSPSSVSSSVDTKVNRMVWRQAFQNRSSASKPR
jgi:hypothetical protein